MSLGSFSRLILYYIAKCVSGSRLDRNHASKLIDKEVQMHGEITFDDILKKNNITSRRGIASAFYALLTKAKAEEIVPTQVFSTNRNKLTEF